MSGHELAKLIEDERLVMRSNRGASQSLSRSGTRWRRRWNRSFDGPIG